MKSNREIKDEARTLLHKSPWGWRVLCVGMIVVIVWSFVIKALAAYLVSAGVQTWESYANAAFRARLSGLDLAIPSLRVAAYMTVATAFVTFINWIFCGTKTFATSSATLCAVTKGDSPNWFKSALSGFARPFGMFSLMFFWVLRIVWWLYLGGIVIGSVAGIFSGLRISVAPAFIVAAVGIVCVCIALSAVAAYRYRFVWFVKVRHPDWGANRCLNESRRLMEGKKWASFRLDCAYWKPIAVWLACFVVFAALLVSAQFLEPLTALESLLSLFPIFLLIFSIYLGLYINFGQAIFYRDLLAEAK